ncbi:DUF4192 domain-containing protein [Streptosporangium sp. KLBMP 9127]|nr:DUF4192 domain-containing protein [Streptosporangium sp. KLBMP 9127]
MATPSSLLLSSPVDVLAAVPYLLGFHPADSLVVIGLTGDPPRGQVCVTTRWDLPIEPGVAAQLVPLTRREQVTQIVLVGYGPGARVTPAVDEIRALAETAGLRVIEALRVERGRFWSYVCARAECCPAEGTPYDPAASPVPAQATLNGMVALRDRAALERSAAPLSDTAREAMREATARAIDEMGRRVRACRDADGFAAAFVADGLARVRAAIETYQEGRRLCDDDVARLGLALAVIRIRDEAWTLIDDPSLRTHLALWGDLTRRLEPRFVPPAAALLGLSAWRDGDCALAGIALERALAADPGYSMANLLMHALHHFLSPGMLAERMPGPADLDEAMGSARMSWLLPMISILDEEATVPG